MEYCKHKYTIALFCKGCKIDPVMKMELALIVLRQTLTMAVYMVMGFTLFRMKLITKEGTKSLSNMLVYAIIPAIVLSSFLTERTPEKTVQLGLSALLALGALAIAVITGRLTYGKFPLGLFAVTFCNCGYFGAPLVSASFGESALFLTVAFIALHNNLQFIYGMSILSGEKMKFRPKDLVNNTILIATVLGLVIYLFDLSSSIHPIITGAIRGIASINSPLAMMVLGVYLAQTKIYELFTKAELYKLSAVRLLLIPAVTFLFLWPLPVESVMKYAVLIVASAPIGVNVAAYSDIVGGDYGYGCQMVTLCTLLSIVVLPGLIALCALVPGF